MDTIGYNIPTIKLRDTDTNRKIRNCNICDEPIFFRYIELYEKQNPSSMLQWRRTLIKQGWMAFDLENPALIHRHRDRDRHKYRFTRAGAGAGPGSKSEVAA